MSYIFYDSSSLTSLNLSNFNNNNVKDMSRMFSDCSSLISLNLSNFNTFNVKYMGNMFNNLNKNCKLICNDERIKNMFCMFYGLNKKWKLYLDLFLLLNFFINVNRKIWTF